jgi:ubiquinone/menaquinone biosynthesis C-methylase UbiE
MLRAVLHRLVSDSPGLFRWQQKICSLNFWAMRGAFAGLTPPAGARVLDVGCGAADCAALLLDRFKRHSYTGMDNNPDYILSNKKRFPGAEFILAENLSPDKFKDASFDCALVFAVLHHLDDAQAAGFASQLRRVLAPGGTVLTAEPVFRDKTGLSPRKIYSNFALRHDRGRHIRTAAGYESFFSGFKKDTAFMFTASTHLTWGARFRNIP